ncbi:unnamed protein product [Cladocopium goreaui]|uniref:Uncharacterized protein n=1 Tax=Cladocopium goreaui TaxID=2562237 RepID=A0A9P1FUF5_9DINO|nr:unnamed protein product [Cladocopium goreaui]
MSDRQVEELTLKIGELEISVRRRSNTSSEEVTASSSLAGPRAAAAVPAAAEERREASPTVSSAWSVVDGPRAWSPEWKRALLEASTASEILAVDLQCVEHLQRYLSAEVTGWTSLARLGRALRAGLAARNKLDGAGTFERSPDIGLSNRIYVVLRGAPGAAGRSLRAGSSGAMAAGAGGLAQADVEARVAEVRAKGLIPALQFSAIAEDGTILWKSQAYVVRYRAGDFMFLVPGEAEVVEFFEIAGPFDFYAYHQTTVQVETARGRALGSVDAVLVDCPWAALPFFRKMTALAMMKFVYDGVTCRPSREGTLFAAEAWIAENMDGEAADEYVSCEEAFVAGEAAGDGEELGQVHSVEQLQAHIQDLELQLAALTQHQIGSAPARPLQQAQGLLGAVPKAPGVPAQTMERLRNLAGAGPTRLGGHEKRDWALELIQNGADVFETLQQELEAGDGDELARMTADAIHAALSSGNDPSSSSSSGIKGCLAREAFLKISDNLVSIAQGVETNALMELGLSSAQLSPGLLRDYLEKRVPLGSFRLLTQMGFMMASAYETGQRTGNRELAGFGAKGLEQTALDEGKTSLSWLLTGLPEPNFP